MDALSDIFRNMQNLVCLGKITQVDHSSLRARVDISGRETGWLRIPGHVGRNWRGSLPLRAGTPVLCGCPSGDPRNAVIITVLYNDTLPPPSLDDTLDVIAFESGTTITHDALTGDITIVGARNITFQAAETLTLEGKNIELRTGKGGYHLTDNAGRATRLSHKGGTAFTSDSWTAGSIVTGSPDKGYHPPRVEGGE